MSSKSGVSVIELTQPELENNSTVQAFPLQSYGHPVYGKMDMTKEVAAKMAEQVNSGLVGHDIAVNYDHKPGKAAGWVRNAEVKEDGLYLNVDWTDEGADHIRAGRYKYLSPEIRPEWKHPITGEKHKKVFSGIALTNTPFLLDIEALELSEEGSVMDTKLRGLLKLADTADEAQIFSAIEKLATDNASLSEKVEQLQEAAEEKLSEEEAPSTLEQKLSEAGLDDVAQLLSEQNEQLRQLTLKQKLSTVDSQIQSWRNGKNAFSQGTLDKARDFLIDADADTGEKFAAVMNTIAESGVVVQETGGSTIIKESAPPMDAADVDKLVREIMDKQKLSYDEAFLQLYADPEKSYEHRLNSYSQTPIPHRN